MTSQIRGLNQAARNANDGISLAQTAEGAIGEIGSNLQRLRELAVQSANATNSASDRASLDSESTQLINEITRVAGQTSFNGITLLNGTFTSQTFQVGANANQTISVTSIADARATALGSNILLAAGTLMGTTKAAAATLGGGNLIAVEAGLTVNTVNGGTTAAFGYAALADAKAIAAAINTNAASVGVTATASNSATLSSLSVAGTVSFTLGGTSTAAISAAVTDPTDLTALMGAINGAAGTTGVTATFTSTSAKNSLTLTSSDGSDISILDYANSGAVGATVAFSGVTLTEADGAGTDSSIKVGSVSLDSSKGAITLAGHNADVFNTATSTFSSVASISLTSAANAQLAIAVVDAALSQVNVSRGDLGSYQNRFSSAIANLQTTSENVSAARSRIQDADFASETAEFTRASIIQQAGISILAQANSLPQQVLSLLRG
jgi:flagellin